MGKLIKNHLARLVTLVAATFHLGATVHCYIWPKILWDPLTLLLNDSVKPIPILQTLNLVAALANLALDAPFPLIAGTLIHRSIELRLLFFYPVAALLASLIYQATDAAGYYIIGIALWFWAYAEGEVVTEKAWGLPRKGGGTRR